MIRQLRGFIVKSIGLMILASLLLASCGRDRGTEYDPYGQSSKVDYSDYANWNTGGGGSSALPGIGSQPLGGSSYGLDTIEGDNADGSLSAEQMQMMQQYISNLSDQNKKDMQSVLLNNLRQCAFPPAGASTVASCRSGNGAACANAVSGFAMGYLLANASKMNINVDPAMLAQLAAACAAVDDSNPAAVQKHIKQKSDACKSGSKIGCGGLLMMLGKLFMKALTMAFGLLQSKL